MKVNLKIKVIGYLEGKSKKNDYEYVIVHYCSTEPIDRGVGFETGKLMVGRDKWQDDFKPNSVLTVTANISDGKTFIQSVKKCG